MHLDHMYNTCMIVMSQLCYKVWSFIAASFSLGAFHCRVTVFWARYQAADCDFVAGSSSCPSVFFSCCITQHVGHEVETTVFTSSGTCTLLQASRSASYSPQYEQFATCISSRAHQLDYWRFYAYCTDFSRIRGGLDGFASLEHLAWYCLS